MRRVFLPAALALLGIAGAAQAHPKLLSASPAANATVAKPARITLRFSEKLMPKFSGADLVMTGHGGTEHAPMKVTAAAAVISCIVTIWLVSRARRRYGGWCRAGAVQAGRRRWSRCCRPWPCG